MPRQRDRSKPIATVIQDAARAGYRPDPPPGAPGGTPHVGSPRAGTQTAHETEVARLWRELRYAEEGIGDRDRLIARLNTENDDLKAAVRRGDPP